MARAGLKRLFAGNRPAGGVDQGVREVGNATAGAERRNAGLPDAQQLVLVEKQRDGRLTMKEILQVRFSQLEGGEGGHPDRGSAPRRVS